jgi:hypothetical protein
LLDWLAFVTVLERHLVGRYHGSLGPQSSFLLMEGFLQARTRVEYVLR